MLTNQKELYTWGSNEFGQLGIDAKHTKKQIEYYTFQVEEKEENVIGNNLSRGDVQSHISEEDDKKEFVTETAIKFESQEPKGQVQVAKLIQKNFLGLPTLITSIHGNIEAVACGAKNSFVIVKI